MTIKQTLTDIRALPHMSATFITETDEYRVTYTAQAEPDADIREAMAYYDTDADSAYFTAMEMSQQA